MATPRKLLAIGLLTIFLTACSACMVSYRFEPLHMVWFQQGTPDTEMRSDLETCRFVAYDAGGIRGCMQAKGYLLIPSTEAELLRVRSLQDKGLNIEDIAARLHWSRDKVLRYMDEEYELAHTGPLGEQPVEILTSIGKPAVKPLIVRLRDNDALVRRNAVEALGEIKDPRAVGPLIDMLKDTDSLIRRHAVKALGRIKDLRAVMPLIEVLNDKNEESHVRMSAAEALGWIAEPDAIEPLVCALKDSYWNVRSQAAIALGRIADLRAVEPLISALHDEDALVRGYVVDALGEIDDMRAIEPLRAALKDTDRDVRKKAQQALTKITTKNLGDP